MGLLWGAKAAAAQDPSQSTAPAAQDAAQRSQAAAAAAAQQSSKPAAQKTDNTDPEMRSFLEEVMGEVKSMRDADAASAAAAAASKASEPDSSSKKLSISPWGSRWASSTMSGQTPAYSPPATTSTTSSSVEPTTEDPDNPNNDPRLSPLAESLLPTTMNCESAFNLAFHCRSLGGQFTALYRYGSVRSCNEQWDDFWFCMRAKGFAEGKVKEDAIRDHYRQKELAKYGPGMPSSENIWRERKERVKPGEAFVMPVEAAVRGDAELQRWEMERMERIRKGLRDVDDS